MKKNEKLRIKIEDWQKINKGQQTLTTGLPPDKSSFFTFHFSFFNFRQFSIVIYLLLILLFFSNAYAQQTVKREDTLTGDEYKVISGFIYNFAVFTEWNPDAFESPDSAIHICFVSDKAGVSLSALNGKYIKKRKIIVTDKNKPQPFMSIFNTIAQKDKNKDNINRCHILFIASENKEFIKEQLSLAGYQNILTIGETEDFIQMCGIIRFFKKNNRLKFEVNLGAAQRAGLKLGSQLLMSAEIVKGCK